MTAKIEPWMRLAASVIADEWMSNRNCDTLSMRLDSISAIIAAHAPKQLDAEKLEEWMKHALPKREPSVPVSALKKLERHQFIDDGIEFVMIDGIQFDALILQTEGEK